MLQLIHLSYTEWIRNEFCALTFSCVTKCEHSPDGLVISDRGRRISSGDDNVFKIVEQSKYIWFPVEILFAVEQWRVFLVDDGRTVIVSCSPPLCQLHSLRLHRNETIKYRTIQRRLCLTGFKCLVFNCITNNITCLEVSLLELV